MNHLLCDISKVSRKGNLVQRFGRCEWMIRNLKIIMILYYHEKYDDFDQKYNVKLSLITNDAFGQKCDDK